MSILSNEIYKNEKTLIITVQNKQPNVLTQS